MLSTSALGESDTPTGEECPGASAWEREQQTASVKHASDDPQQTISEPALLKDLRIRVEKDQAARKRWLADQGSSALAADVDSVDAVNLVWLRRLIAEKGFPNAAQVGKEGVHLAWILLQHADQDPELQRGLVPILEQRFFSGELPGNDLARITDRVRMASGEPQTYGTQFDWFSGDFKLPEPSRLVEIDAARAKLGLMPLVDYVCTIRKQRNTARQ